MRKFLLLLASTVFLLASGLNVRSQESKADRQIQPGAIGRSATETAPSQTGCTKLLVMAGNWNRPEVHIPNRFSPAQMKWWLNEGQKKFKNVCLALRIEDADYVFLWAQQWRDHNQQIVVPKTTTTQHSGTVNTSSTNGTSTSGTYQGTSSTTTYENESYEYTEQRATAYLYKTEGVDEKRQVMEIPIFTSNHKGYWSRSKPDKDVLVDALKYISKQTQ